MGFISESRVYGIQMKRDLISAPNHILISAANEFSDKKNFIDQMSQTDFTYFIIFGWGWYYLSTITADILFIGSYVVR